MITFKTQEEFDAAVMAAVEKCLGVSISVKTINMGQETKVYVSLKNNYVEFCKDSDIG